MSASQLPALERAFGPRWRRVVAALALLHALPFLCRPVLLGGDEPHYALMAHSLAVDRDADLADDYARVRAGSPEAGARFAGRELAPHVAPRFGREGFTHGLGLPLLAAPGVFVLSLLAPNAPPDPLLAGLTLIVTFAALLAGIGLLGRLLEEPRSGAVAALAIYFGTPLWFYSRTFFADPYLWALPVLAVACLVHGRPASAGALLGLAFLCKESAAVVVLPIAAAAFARLGVRRIWPAVVSGAVVGAAWLIRGWWLFDAPFATSQPFVTGGWRGFVGVLCDPRHGLVPFAPVVVLALATKAPTEKSVLRAAWAVALATLVLSGAWIEWGGGTCYGPRLLLPALAAIAVPLALAWQRRQGHPAFGVGFFALAAGGFALGLLAAGDPFRAAWSPSVFEIIGARPLATAIAVGVAAGGAVLLARFARAPRPQ